ncbi:hypothetical protein [Agrobacterium sp. T29]|uniref:hypothetical protein n=1 Tax=Agrobacterium sp. T29 TaxID=2580515 RepID=UPI00115D06EE|nr:hypothetical protein [Agrobacterium sp. T29]
MAEHIHGSLDSLRLYLTQLKTKAEDLDRECARLRAIVSQEIKRVEDLIQKQVQTTTGRRNRTLGIWIVAFAAAWWAPIAPTLAQTGTFVDVMTRDPATTNVQNRLCYTTNGRVDIGCPADAPYLDVATGRLGIGTTNPTQALDVSGSIYVGGTLGTGAGGSMPVISQNQIPLLHTFTPTGTNGGNLFLGRGSGNFTMAYISSANDASYNTGVGMDTLQGITTGKYNTAIGWTALASTSVASYNTAVGIAAMAKNVTAGSNVAVGAYSLYNANAGVDNVVIGGSSLLAMRSSFRNTTVGAYTMSNSGSGNDNTVVGHASMQYKNGSFNTTVGKNAGGVNGGTITGTVALGFEAGKSLATNTSNTLVGYRAGASLTTGSNNIIIGASTDAPVAAGSNQLNIGNAVWGDIGSGSGHANKLGVNVSSPSSSLHVSGTLRLTGGSETCDTNRLGAIRYTSGSFDVCRSIANGWEPLATTGKDSAVDRITSSSMAGVTANATGYISLTTGGITGTAYFSPNSVLVNKGISATGGVSATQGYFAATLEVSGAIKISGDGTEGCGSTSDKGKMRINPATGRLQICVD